MLSRKAGATRRDDAFLLRRPMRPTTHAADPAPDIRADVCTLIQHEPPSEGSTVNLHARLCPPPAPDASVRGSSPKAICENVP